MNASIQQDNRGKLARVDEVRRHSEALVKTGHAIFLSPVEVLLQRRTYDFITQLLGEVAGVELDHQAEKRSLERLRN